MARRSRQPRLPELERRTVDGVPLLFIETDGPTVAGLVFRVGQADETIPIRGITHLVEHLALHSIGSVHYQHNGTVDLTEATFMARGEPDEVGDFMGTVCRTLASLPVDRIGLEAQILRTEAAGRSINPPALMTYLRHGFTAYGLPWLPEFFLNDPRPGPTLEWASCRFNRGNCALWVAGQMPPNLTLPLPEGNRYPLPEARQIGGLALPASIQWGKDTVAVDYISPRTPESTALVRIILKRFHDQIRQARGLTYLAAGYRESLSTMQAENVLWLSCLESQSAQVRAEALAILESMASNGPTQQELDEDLAGFVRNASDPAARVGQVVGAASYEITGMPPHTLAQFIEEQEAITPASCAAELAQALTTGILAAPALAGGPPQGMAGYPISCAPITGMTHRPQRSRPWERTEVLIAGPEGISRVSRDGAQAVTVRWAECVGWVQDPNGTWHLLGADGFAVDVRPTDWSKSAALMRVIGDHVARELIVAGPPA
jgi:hypothetical protein